MRGFVATGVVVTVTALGCGDGSPPPATVDNAAPVAVASPYPKDKNDLTTIVPADARGPASPITGNDGLPYGTDYPLTRDVTVGGVACAKHVADQGGGWMCTLAADLPIDKPKMVIAKGTDVMMQYRVALPEFVTLSELNPPATEMDLSGIPCAASFGLYPDGALQFCELAAAHKFGPNELPARTSVSLDPHGTLTVANLAAETNLGGKPIPAGYEVTFDPTGAVTKAEEFVGD
jgi:hypothetical protein